MSQRITILATVAFSLACDPVAGVTVHTALRPAPVRMCLDSALFGSRVARIESLKPTGVQKRQDDRAFYAFFEDGSRDAFAANLSVAFAGDSLTQLTVKFVWIGRLDSVSSQERRKYADRAATLLRELQRACGRSPDAPIECEEYEIFSKGQGQCSVAAT